MKIYKTVWLCKQLSVYALVYTEFILVRLWKKLLAYRNTLESVPGTNQYWAINAKFLAQGNNGLSPTGFEPMRLGIVRLPVRRFKVKHPNHVKKHIEYTRVRFTLSGTWNGVDFSVIRCFHLRWWNEMHQRGMCHFIIDVFKQIRHLRQNEYWLHSM